MFHTRARGKLLLTAEYFVLDGALALAVPVRFGQTLQVGAGIERGTILWRSRNPDGDEWFQAKIAMPELKILEATDAGIAGTLVELLGACARQQPGFFQEGLSYEVVTQNDFPREWGLGTSSTLIAAMARWVDVDPYSVLFETMGGSGYDIACAYTDGPILYQLDHLQPKVQEVALSGPLGQLYFVFLGKKQNSREGIARYRERVKENPELIETVSGLTRHFLAATRLEEWNELIREHESLVAETLGLPRAKDLYFQDFPGEIKSLGAWGGDFVLATSPLGGDETKAWFREKGFSVCFSWEEMVG
jgi:mevalonate kinase